MNVKELILSHPAVDIAAALIDCLDVEPAKRDKGRASAALFGWRLHPQYFTIRR